jgi:integrase/recombinase XerD
MTERSVEKLQGPLAPHASDFERQLRAKGYAKSTITGHIRLLAHLSRWLEDQGLAAAGVMPDCIDQFLVVRRQEGYRQLITAKAVQPLLNFLREREVVARPRPSVPITDEERLLCRYHDYLVAERALARRVVARWDQVARMFVREQGEGQAFNPADLTTTTVRAFLTKQLPRRGPAAGKQLAAALRCFLRFLHAEGSLEVPLAQAVPSVAGWRGASLPRGVSPGELSSLLGSCDRRTARGRRDYAVLVLLARLGLRAGEVAGLNVDDLDWRAGEIVVRRKGGREERLPLPVDVGEAVAGYLMRGRARSDSRSLFLRAVAPCEGLSPTGVSRLVYDACDRAGLAPMGAHRLRHTAATTMLQAGATLAEVGQVLGHSVPLAQFLTYCEGLGVDRITSEVALAWVELPANATVAWWRLRLSAVRGFATYLQAIDPDTQVPPTGTFPAARRQGVPYLYSEADIVGLMEAARHLRSPLHATTYETLIGLLAVTGMRIGEAIRLDRGDISWEQGLLLIRDSKFGKSREVPVDPSTLEALGSYAKRRDWLCSQPKAPSFFVSMTGRRLLYDRIQPVFAGLVRQAGLAPRSGQCRPRIHGLRHSFAVRTLLGWYRSGVQVEAALPLLSTFLGHADPKSTYWYLSATPQLLGIATKRLDIALGELP